MIQWFKVLSKSGFVRNVFLVVSGAAGAQAITMAFAPIITRIYGPEAFGLQGTFIAILAVLTPIAALTYPIAIVLPKSDQDALGVAKLSAVLALGMATLTAVIISIFGDYIAVMLGIQSIEGFLLLIPVAMLFVAFYQILQQWLIRKKEFKTIAKFAVIQALTVNSAKAGIGWFNPVGAVLIILSTVGNAIHALLLCFGMRTQSSALPPVVSDDHPCTVKELAKRYRDFPIFRAPQALLNAISQSLPVLMLSSFIGPAAAGYYALSKTVMSMPINLLSKSLGEVFYPRINEASLKGEKLFGLIIRATLILAVIGAIPFTFIFAFGPWLFAFFFGEEWLTAGEYARWMALWLFLGFINRPSVVAIPVLGMLSGFLYYEIISLAVRGLSLFSGLFFFNDAVLAVAFFSVSGFLMNSILIIFVTFKSRSFQ